MQVQGKRIAVTGPSGFIGRHVIDALQQSGATVLPLTRKEADIGNGKLPGYTDIGSPDVLLHLAWDKLDNYKDASHLEVTLPAHYAFLEHLVETGLPAMVVTGTCFEYGMQEGELDEGRPTQPHLPYCEAKDNLRKQLSALQESHPFSLTWARLFYTYGDGQPERTLYSQLKKAIERKDTSFDMSPGDQLRDFLPINDLAQALATVTLSCQDHGIVNICSGKPITVKALVEKILSEHGASMHLNTGAYPYATYEPKSFWGNAAKLSTILKGKI